ncbi:flavin reductase like domain-containing protein [Hypoxylon sp. FL1150]|nr:flavin reductase like domain-containing protein [Hypoxylon sp. FL1150]
MKCLRGLRWAPESTTPRYVRVARPFHTTAKAQVGFLTRWRNSKPAAWFNQAAKTPRVNSTLQRRPENALGRSMRASMRQLPHPVVVITTLENMRSVDRLEDILDKKFPRPIPRAMTVSSFTSLSIEPVPRVTFNVTLPSTTYEAIVKCGTFNAHILSGDDHGARIAELFTRGNRPPAAIEESEAGKSEAGKSEDGNKHKSNLGVLAGLEELGVEIQGQEEWQREWDQAGEYGQDVISTVRGGGYIKDVRPPPEGTLPILQGRGIMHILKCKFRKLTPPSESDFEHHAIVMGEVLDITPGDYEDGYGIALAYADRAYRRLGEKLLERPAPEQEVPLTVEDTSESVDLPLEDSENQKGK